MKIIKYIFLVIWTLWSLFGIIKNYSSYNLNDWIFIIAFVALPYILLWYLSYRKKAKALFSENIEKATIQQIDTPSAVSKPETTYIEDDKIIAKIDRGKITNDEVPYLIKIEHEKAVAKWKIGELTRLITESYTIIQTTDNPEILCSRYNFIVEKINELISIEQQGLYDKNILCQYKALISDDNFYNLIMKCYQKYITKARSELKTKRGISNRINKFWQIIHATVSEEFYNSKIKIPNS